MIYRAKFAKHSFLLPALAALAALALYSDSIARDADGDIKNQIIAESIASYPGNCPCPYNLAKNGSHCGKRSAYSRPGGYSPLCYESDVTPEMIEAYKKRKEMQHDH